MDAHRLDELSSPALSPTEENSDAKGAKRSRVSGIDRALQVIDYLYETDRQPALTPLPRQSRRRFPPSM